MLCCYAAPNAMQSCSTERRTLTSNTEFKHTKSMHQLVYNKTLGKAHLTEGKLSCPVGHKTSSNVRETPGRFYRGFVLVKERYN